MWNVLGMGIKTAAKLYSDKQKTKEALSEARLLHAEKMKRGEIEYKGKVFEHQKGDWKDEFVLLTISSPLFLLAYSMHTKHCAHRSSSQTLPNLSLLITPSWLSSMTLLPRYLYLPNQALVQPKQIS